jgi:hypothetical protein
MSRHVPRKARWFSFGPNEHRSDVGRVYFKAGQWHAELVYRVHDPERSEPGEVETWEASRFKRPRNAMIALEDRATELQRRHGAHVVFITG